MARPSAPLPVPRHTPNLDEDRDPVTVDDFGPHRQLADGVLAGADAANADWSRSALTRVVLSDCRCTGIDLSEAQLRDVELRRCKLDYANLRLARLDRVRFVECAMVDADFGGAELSECVFDACDLTTADLSNATMRSTDLRGCRLSGLRGASALRGALIDTVQLLELAPELARARHPPRREGSAGAVRYR
jgi:uncharacterized protein YjbI with pentapeptide repeats